MALACTSRWAEADGNNVSPGSSTARQAKAHQTDHDNDYDHDASCDANHVLGDDR